MADVRAATETPVNLVVEEVGESRELPKEEYGIEPAAAAAAVTDPIAGAAAETEEKSPFDVVFKNSDSAKLVVAKAVRKHIGLGFREVKELVDAAPASIKKGVNKATAEALKAALKGAGAKVELR